MFVYILLTVQCIQRYVTVWSRLKEERILFQFKKYIKINMSSRSYAILPEMD